MKKTLLLLLISTLAFTASKASNGDTTWVQANIVNLDNYNKFDTKVKFPDGSKTYRQVLQIFTLGEYNCPAGAQYCHQWDYTVTNYVMTKTGDTAEISRFITPYANTGVSRFPATWKHPYVFDVTDYVNLLKDSATVQIFYSGYSGGFTANVKFAFIEGTPARNVLGQEHLWSNYYTYGNGADPIDNHVLPYTLNVPTNTAASELKFTVTGHGADATDNCCEFSNTGNWHSYSVMTNGTKTDTKLIYKNDCGSNGLYPQGGTWIYNRANWCPGSQIQVNSHSLPVSAGSTVDVNFSNYTGTTSLGGFQVNGEVFYYGNFNHSVDAAISAIISPNNDQNYYRENPSGDKPRIRISNTGSSVINSVSFQYNVKDSLTGQYTWNGTLAPLHDTIIDLPTLNALTALSQSGTKNNQQFIVKITAVNGAPDEDLSNNIMYSTFATAPVWPQKIIITFNTNNEGVSALNVNPSETSWQITDINNTVIASRSNVNINKKYIDTIAFASGMYHLEMKDLGCDGLHWWVYDQNPNIGVNAGSFTVRKFGSPAYTSIPMNGYNYSGTYNNDFGCEFSQYFSINKSSVTGLYTYDNQLPINIFPNPSTGLINIDFTDMDAIQKNLIITSVTGQTVYTKLFDKSDENATLELDKLNAGIYFVNVYYGSKAFRKKLVITK
jgi:hypothetical protein